MIELLLTFAIQVGGFQEMCVKTECPVPIVMQADLGVKQGEYSWKNPDRVLIDKTLVEGSVEWNAAVVHELVHYLQYLAGTYNSSMDCALKVEKQAYMVSEKYWASKGVEKEFGTHLFSVAMSCIKDYEHQQ